MTHGKMAVLENNPCATVNGARDHAGGDWALALAERYGLPFLAEALVLASVINMRSSAFTLLVLDLQYAKPSGRQT